MKKNYLMGLIFGLLSLTFAGMVFASSDDHYLHLNFSAHNDDGDNLLTVSYNVGQGTSILDAYQGSESATLQNIESGKSDSTKDQLLMYNSSWQPIDDKAKQGILTVNIIATVQGYSPVVIPLSAQTQPNFTIGNSWYSASGWGPIYVTNQDNTVGCHVSADISSSVGNEIYVSCGTSGSQSHIHTK